MRSIFAPFLLAFSLLFLLQGCGHFEPSFFGNGSNDASGQEDGTIDISGVNDGVNAQKILVKRVAFPSDEYARLNINGHSTIKGTISISYHGHTIPGRQTKLYLNPVTTYSNQWYRESYLGGHKMSKSDPKLFNYLKFTSSDNSGHFAFYVIGSGDYYVAGNVKCSECGGRSIPIARKITVGNSGTVTIHLDKTL